MGAASSRHPTSRPDVGQVPKPQKLKRYREMIGRQTGGDQLGPTLSLAGPHRPDAKTAPTLVRHDSLPPREEWYRRKTVVSLSQ